MRAHRGRHLAEWARPLVVQARDSSPFTRNCRRITAQAKTARPGTTARVVTNMTKRSFQAIALWRCAARTRRIDGLGITAEVLENPFNDCWVAAGLTFDQASDTIRHMRLGPRESITHSQRCDSCARRSPWKCPPAASTTRCDAHTATARSTPRASAHRTASCWRANHSGAIRSRSSSALSASAPGGRPGASA